MGNHVKNRRDVCARTYGKKHEAKLRDRAVGQNFFDVILRNGNCCGVKRRCCTDDCNHCGGPVV